MIVIFDLPLSFTREIKVKNNYQHPNLDLHKHSRPLTCPRAYWKTAQQETKQPKSGGVKKRNFTIPAHDNIPLNYTACFKTGNRRQVGGRSGRYVKLSRDSHVGCKGREVHYIGDRSSWKQTLATSHFPSPESFTLPSCFSSVAWNCHSFSLFLLSLLQFGGLP